MQEFSLSLSLVHKLIIYPINWLSIGFPLKFVLLLMVTPCCMVTSKITITGRSSPTSPCFFYRTTVILIESFARLTSLEVSKIESVRLLGYNEKVPWKMEDKGLKVALPSMRPNVNGYVLKIALKNN